MLEGNGHEGLPETEPVEAETILVILGEAGGLEDAVGLGAGEAFQGLARVARANPGGGKEPPKGLACREVFGMAFGEVVAIEAVREVGETRGEGKDRDLDHVGGAGMEIDEKEFVRVNQVLGVVNQDQIVAETAFLFVKQQPLVNPVQAIGLGGGAVVGTEAEVNLPVAFFEAADGFQGGFVVRVGADEDGVVVVADG